MSLNNNHSSKSNAPDIRFDPTTQTAHIGELVLGQHDGHNVLIGDQEDDPEATFALSVAIGEHWREHGMPPLIVHLGWDDDYVFPPSIDEDSICGAPFRCHSCGQRVKRATGVFGAVYVCYCMGVTIPRGSREPEPRSGVKWSNIRTAAKEAEMIILAKTSGSEN